MTSRLPIVAALERFRGPPDRLMWPAGSWIERKTRSGGEFGLSPLGYVLLPLRQMPHQCRVSCSPGGCGAVLLTFQQPAAPWAASFPSITPPQH